MLCIAWLIDPGTTWGYLKNADWRWIVGAILVVQVQVILSALRWRLTASRLGHPIELRHAIAEYYLASFANLSLPGGVTGDAARVYRNRHAQGLGIAAHGVLLERMAGQITFALIAFIGWCLWPLIMQGDMPQLGVRLLLTTVLLVFLGVVSLVLFIRFAPDWSTRFIVDMGPSIHSAWLADWQWVRQLIFSLGIVSTYLLIFFFSSHAVAAPISVAVVVTIVPLVLLSMVVPLSIGGWGVREASAALLWPVAGLSSEAGVATSVIYALISLLGCLPGLVLVRIAGRN